MESQQLEAISLKMYKIENRRPNDYRQNYLWQKLNQMRDRLSVELAKEQLEYHKDRLARMGEKDAFDSVVKIQQYEKYLEKYNKKGEVQNDTKIH